MVPSGRRAVLSGRSRAAVSQTSRQCCIRAAEAVAKGASAKALIVTTSTSSEGQLSNPFVEAAVRATMGAQLQVLSISL